MSTFCPKSPCIHMVNAAVASLGLPLVHFELRSLCQIVSAGRCKPSVQQPGHHGDAGFCVTLWELLLLSKDTARKSLSHLPPTHMKQMDLLIDKCSECSLLNQARRKKKGSPHFALILSIFLSWNHEFKKRGSGCVGKGGTCKISEMEQSPLCATVLSHNRICVEKHKRPTAWCFGLFI